MRLAFVDLLFSWPPNGGADVDLYHTVIGLRDLGHEVHVFVAACDTSWERGNIEACQLPFPSTRLEFTRKTLNPREVSARFREVVDEWKPDVVFMADGFFLKPFVSEALGHYPLIGRFYAYEAVCIRDSLLFKNEAPCPMNFVRTPNVCRQCAVNHLKPEIQRGRYLTWAQEFLAAHAYMPAFHRTLVSSLGRYNAIIVSNTLMKEQFAGVSHRVHILPGGVNVSDFSYSAPAPKGAADRKIILMSGRVEDPMKGLKTLLEAGGILAQSRSDFEIWATHSDHSLDSAWFKALGWYEPAGLRALYAEADICVVPSIWEEPFGLVAVEAMASGRPVCASRVGGLQHIVRHGETGFLCARADAGDLARRLSQLLDDAEMRRRMGDEARRVVESEYDWKRVIATHYPPLLESVRG